MEQRKIFFHIRNIRELNSSKFRRFQSRMTIVEWDRDRIEFYSDERKRGEEKTQS